MFKTGKRPTTLGEEVANNAELSDALSTLDICFEKAKNEISKESTLSSQSSSEPGEDSFLPSYSYLTEICRLLTTRKAYRTDTSSKTGKTLKYRVNEAKIIKSFWYYCNAKTHILIETFVETYVNQINEYLNSENGSQLLNIWEKLYKTFSSWLKILYPIINYVPSNYLQLVPEYRKQGSYFTYIFGELGHLLADRLGEKLGPFITYCLQVFLDNNISYSTVIKEGRIYSFASLKVADTVVENMPFITYCQNVTNKYMEQHWCLNDFKTNPHGTITKAIQKYTTISVLLDLDTDDNLYGEYFKTTIMAEKNILNLMCSFKKSITIIYPHSTDSMELLQWETIRKFIELAYIKYSSMEEYTKIVQRQIRSDLKIAYGKTHNLHTLFRTLYDLFTLFSYTPKFMDENILIELRDLLGGPLKVAEAFLRYCELTIRRADFGLNNSNKHDNEDINECKNLVLALSSFLKLDDTFFKLFKRSCFRRIIMKGYSNMSNIGKGDSFERYLVQHFETTFHHCDEVSKITALYKDALDTYHCSSAYMQDQLQMNRKEESNSIHIEAFVFGRENIPVEFQDNISETITLPEVFEKEWTNFIERYKENIKNSEMKSIIPVYPLHHCELSSPFNLPNGESLLFDLTLFQTCVILQFNDIDELSFGEIQHNLQMKEETLRLILKSFIDMNLLLKIKDVYKYNENFQYDIKKIKDGKLRIPIPRISSSGSSLSSRSSSDLLRHNEGSTAHWKQELLKACIVRSLKRDREGMNYDKLFKIVESQMKGFSIGEFKDALKITVQEKHITLTGDAYIY
ncbi:cullin RTT101 NDAI_0G05880 [Naumovozyma dairenensis CBS 421]|uniref:Cullin family profile domain-containing protein n=1 Tax=Naumovozyma dairenensis (strain ATCC 10597 / BCRC 20456 / CBS 421 / NBRC 0211 / NRRL Y-12639) TaxID=1071378 RepID=J7S4P7_NAUDC|nr:hypothetical protein NDAI_0G05880 [Naumovozyma dairenensis CBS 421]CCK73571.1 hypothetical protein NDAI_0G05880 [Naumovozyma dairenensis CBS 421]